MAPHRIQCPVQEMGEQLILTPMPWSAGRPVGALYRPQERPTSASTGDQGVRPTAIVKNYPRQETSACGTVSPLLMSNPFWRGAGNRLCQEG
jgi:hypothetical protein